MCVPRKLVLFFRNYVNSQICLKLVLLAAIIASWAINANMKVMRIRKWITLYFRILPLVLAAQLDSLSKRLIPIKMCRRGAIACFAPVGQEMYKDFCYTSQLKYVFRLEEHVVTCRGSKLANSLGKQRLELSTRT